MDVLSDVLKAVRLTGAIFFERHLHAPWVGESPHSAAIAATVMPDAEHVISFHAILSGSCWAALVGNSESSKRFNAGDIVIYPMGDANVRVPRLACGVILTSSNTVGRKAGRCRS